VLFPSSFTVDGSDRADKLTYDIPTVMDMNADPFVIKAKAVSGLLDACDLKTKIQWLNPIKEYECMHY
jgi:hypothetical protein